MLCDHENCTSHYGGKKPKTSLKEHKRKGIHFGCQICRCVWDRRNYFYDHRKSINHPLCSESVLVPLAQHEVGNFRATGIAPALISRRITGTPPAVGVSMAVNAPATVDAPVAVGVLVAVEDPEVIDVDAYVPRPSVIVTNPFNTTPRQLAAPVSRPISPDSVTSSSVIEPDSIPIPPPLPVVASSLLNIVPPRLHTDLQVLLMRLLTYVFVLPSVT